MRVRHLLGSRGEIVAQTFAVLRPGGVAAWICGDFVRNKQRVPFGEQWLALCESVGFEPLAWAVAWKQTDHGAQLDIFGEAIPQQTTRVASSGGWRMPRIPPPRS